MSDPGAFLRAREPSARLIVRSSTSGPAGITFGNRVYVRQDVLEAGGPALEALLVHEAEHVRQYRWCGLGLHALAGLPLFFLLYGLVFFPVLGAWARYRFELAAAAAAWRWMRDHGWDRAVIELRCRGSAEQVAGRAYFWALPRRWVRWGFLKKLERVCGR